MIPETTQRIAAGAALTWLVVLLLFIRNVILYTPVTL